MSNIKNHFKTVKGLMQLYVPISFIIKQQIIGQNQPNKTLSFRKTSNLSCSLVWLFLLGGRISKDIKVSQAECILIASPLPKLETGFTLILLREPKYTSVCGVAELGSNIDMF